MSELSFEPLGDQVLVRPDVMVEDTGVIKPRHVERAKGKSGVVFLVGPDADEVSVGDKVVFPEDVGAVVTISQMEYVSIVESEILYVC